MAITRNIVQIPALVDLHVHFREPGFSYKETIASGSMAAAASGYSAVFTMPNLNPVPDTVAHLQEQLDIIKRDTYTGVYPFASITMGQKGAGELVDFEKEIKRLEGEKEKIESEIAEFETYEERQMFLSEIGLEESGVARLIKSAYALLRLKTYFTAGVQEVRAWTFHDGWKAPQCAGVIHTDFEKGFIRAEVIKYEDFLSYGSEAAVKEAGKMGVEGKEYVVQDGDIMHFRFNV